MALAKLIFTINFAQHSLKWVWTNFQSKFVTKSKILCRNRDVSTNHNHYKTNARGTGARHSEKLPEKPNFHYGAHPKSTGVLY
jgi:hypothetical protein